jgi:hypothetical protein
VAILAAIRRRGGKAIVKGKSLPITRKMGFLAEANVALLTFRFPPFIDLFFNLDFLSI